MIKCPVCQCDNEEGALFCEQCKSDLGTPEPLAAQPADQPAGAAGSAQGAAASSAARGEVVGSPAAVAVPAMNPAIPLAAVEAGTAAAEAAFAVAVPLPDTPPLPVAAEGLAVGTGPAAPTAPDASSPVAAAHPAPAPLAAEPPERLPPGAQPKLVVLRGQRVNVEYPLYEGDNYLGRADEKAVDIDLEDQEPPDRIWSSRQHALITYQDGRLTIEDLNSTNGTFVNRLRLHPGHKRPLQVNDVIQIGTVQMRVKI